MVKPSQNGGISVTMPLHMPVNFLHHYLRNVYFFCGTACGGKSTISRAFAKKHGFHWLSEHVINDKYAALADPNYQPAQFDRPADWTEHFLRPVDEYWQWLTRICEEQAPLMLLEAIQLSVERPVAFDCVMPVPMILEVSPPDRLVFLVTDPERAACENLGRPDHQNLTSFIERFARADEIKANIHKLFVYGNAQTLNEIQRSGRLYITRDDDSTIEATLAAVEKHFGIED